MNYNSQIIPYILGVNVKVFMLRNDGVLKKELIDQLQLQD